MELIDRTVTSPYFIGAVVIVTLVLDFLAVARLLKSNHSSLWKIVGVVMFFCVPVTSIMYLLSTAWRTKEFSQES